MIKNTLQQLTECPTCVEVEDLVKTMRACNTLTFLCAILKLVVVLVSKLLSWSKFFGMDDTVPVAMCLFNQDALERFQKLGTVHGNQPLDEERNEEAERDLIPEKSLLKEPLLLPPTNTMEGGDASPDLAPTSNPHPSQDIDIGAPEAGGGARGGAAVAGSLESGE